MCFTYILSGWEGSATDARVWADALAKGLSVPEGFYIVPIRADAGYPHCKELLVPFRGVWYHLQEWGAAGVGMCSIICLLDVLFLFCLNNPIAWRMQRNYLTFVMLRHTMLWSDFLECSSNASVFFNSLLIIPLPFRLAFQLPCVLSRILFKRVTMISDVTARARLAYPGLGSVLPGLGLHFPKPELWAENQVGLRSAWA